LQFLTIFLGHLDCKRYDKLRGLYIFVGNLKCDAIKGIESGVYNLKNDIFWLVLIGVEE
jgi:hypothetical protein